MRLIIAAATLILVFPFIFFANKNSPFTETEKEKNYKADRMIEEGHAFLREGDLVVRINHDPSSQFIKNFNRKDKSYSHAGIVLFKNGYPYVYHIVNGVENPDQKLRKDSLTGFCNPRKNFGYGVFRYNLDSAELKKLKLVIDEWYSREVKFDSSFNLQSDDQMYCSEMIKKSVAFATSNRIKIETTQPTANEIGILSKYIHLDSSAKPLEIVAIDNLYINPNCKLIREYKFFQ